MRGKVIRDTEQMEMPLRFRDEKEKKKLHKSQIDGRAILKDEMAHYRCVKLYCRVVVIAIALHFAERMCRMTLLQLCALKLSPVSLGRAEH